MSVYSSSNKCNTKSGMISQEFRTQYFGSFLSFMEKSELPWGVKDCESRFLYMNKAALAFGNLPPDFDVEGRLDSECPAEWAELAPEFIKHDRQVEQSGNHVEIIQTHFFYREKKLQSYICEKFPIYNEDDDCIGTVNFSKKIKFISAWHYFNSLPPSVLVTEPPNDLFNKRELEVIFLFLQCLCSKEIAKALHLSHRTVENKLQNIWHC